MVSVSVVLSTDRLEPLGHSTETREIKLNSSSAEDLYGGSARMSGVWVTMDESCGDNVKVVLEAFSAAAPHLPPC